MTAFMQAGDDYRVHIQPSNLQPPSGGFRFNGEVRYETRILYLQSMGGVRSANRPEGGVVSRSGIDRDRNFVAVRASLVAVDGPFGVIRRLPWSCHEPIWQLE
jgi:hypothetical protein